MPGVVSCVPRVQRHLSEELGAVKWCAADLSRAVLQVNMSLHIQNNNCYLRCQTKPCPGDLHWLLANKQINNYHHIIYQLKDDLFTKTPWIVYITWLLWVIIPDLD